MNKLDLQYFDVYEVAKNELKLSDVVALDWIRKNIESGRLQEEKLDKKYYVFSIVRMWEEIKEHNVCTKDAYTNRLKALEKKGYIVMVSGCFYTPEFGMCRICINLGKKFTELLAKEV